MNAHHASAPFPAVAFAVVVILVIVVAAAALLRGRRSAYSRYAPASILTEHEAAFFPKLRAAAERVGAGGVFPQMAMSAIVRAAPHLDEQEQRAVRNTYSQKRIDFVLVDDDMKVMLIVELDDRTHDGPMSVAKDRDRDAITRAAGYRTLRLRHGRRITTDQIERHIREALGR